MAGVKEAAAKPVQVPASAEALAAAKKSTELAAGQAMITEAAKRTAETREEWKKEQSEKEEKKEPKAEHTSRDTPELSRQSKWFGIEGKLLENAEQKWTLEMEEELWQALLQWMPVQEQDLSRQLEELSKLYLALLEAVLTHTVGEEQAVQMGRLEEILSQKLNLLLDIDLKDLMAILEENHETEALKKIKSSIYQQTTGEKISYQAADRFYAKGRLAASKSQRYFMPESAGSGAVRERSAENASSSSPASFRASSGEGMIYRLGKGGNIQISQGSDSQRRSEEAQIGQRIRTLHQNGGKADSAVQGKTMLTGRELETANRFAAHMQGSGNLLKHPGFSARNEEVVGLLSALTTIKGQVYGAARNSALKHPLQNAVNQFVDYYLTQKGIYKVYNYTTNLYERTGSSQKAAEEGLDYAYRLFLAKKEDPAYSSQAAYSERAGFFQMLLKGQSPEAELRRGIYLLEQNWREFLEEIGEKEKKGISFKMQRHSPWGILLEAGGTARQEKGKKKRLLLVEIAGAAALLVLYLIYHLFFG